MQGKTVLEEEDELVALVGRLAAQSKCDRVAAYRQLQACSHMTQQLNGRSLDEYDVAGVHVGAVGPSEVRVSRQENGKTMCYIVDVEAETSKQVLPPDLVNVPLLVILLDQGSIGFRESQAEEVEGLSKVELRTVDRGRVGERLDLGGIEFELV